MTRLCVPPYISEKLQMGMHRAVELQLDSSPFKKTFQKRSDHARQVHPSYGMHDKEQNLPQSMSVAYNSLSVSSFE